MSYKEPKIHTFRGSIGNLEVVLYGEQYEGNPVLDTKIIIEEGTICWITWKDRIDFINEIQTVIDKYSI